MPQEADLTKDILNRGREGNPKALAQLVERCQTRVHRLVRRRMGPGLRTHSDSGDVAQEALLQLCKSFPKSCPEDQDQFWRWLNGVVENRLRNLARSRRRLPAGTPAQLHTGIAVAPTMQMDFDSAFEKNVLAEGLAQLSERHLQIVQLRDFQGLAFKQIGAVMSLHAEAAWALHKRAMISLIKSIRLAEQKR